MNIKLGTLLRDLKTSEIVEVVDIGKRIFYIGSKQEGRILPSILLEYFEPVQETQHIP